MHTSTVRLVIFLGMFLAFATDYSELISTIFGKRTESNVTNVAKGPEVHLEEPRDKISILSKNHIDKENGKSRGVKRRAGV